MDESVQKHLEVEVGAMKLSIAIRIGALIRPQGFNRIWDHGKTCALGAALEGRGFDPSKFDDADDDLCASYRQSALKDVWNTDIAHQIVSKNDGGMTREQIADWLEAQGL